jgi:hypothetical protein
MLASAYGTGIQDWRLAVGLIPNSSERRCQRLAVAMAPIKK